MSDNAQPKPEDLVAQSGFFKGMSPIMAILSMIMIIGFVAFTIQDVEFSGAVFTAGAGASVSDLDDADAATRLLAIVDGLEPALLLGAAIAVYRFPGRRAAIVLLNGLMALPAVFIGLTVYLLVSRAGPLGFLGILFTPAAMILAQCLLITPIIAALSHQVLRALYESYREQLCSLGARPRQIVWTLLWDARFGLTTVVMAGFGRAVAEVGAAIIVGGNIDRVTRVMTTTIALETSKGNLSLALALGVVLVLVAVGVNALAALLSGATAPRG